MAELATAAGRAAWRGLTSLPGRLVVTACLLVLIGLKIDWDAVGSSLDEAGWQWFALGVGAVALSFAIGAYRWTLLLAAADLAVSRPRALRVFFVGAFTNNLLPTGFGGDLVRSVMIAPRGPRLARSITSVLVDRISALGCLIAVGWIGLALDPGAVPGRLVGLLAIVSVAGAVGLALAIALVRRGRIGRWLPGRLRPWASEAAAVLRAYLGAPALLARVALIGISFQAVLVCAMWLLARTIGLELALALLAVTLPLVLVATLLPISVGGFGVREGAFVALLGTAGVSGADATVLSLLSVAALAIASLPGGLAIVTGTAPPRRPAGHSIAN